MRRALFALLVFFLLTACGLVPGLPAPAAPQEPTATPLPTSVAPEFPTIPDRSCLLATLEPIRTNQQQGNLMVWHPEEMTLAYVAPKGRSIWFTGEILLSSGSDYKTSTVLFENTSVFGDLTWSPSGKQLAFVALRQPENVYTVMVDNLETRQTVDILPGEQATLTSGSGSKGIVEWLSENQIRIIASCGADCDVMLDVNLSSGQVVPYGETMRHQADRLSPTRKTLSYDEKTYPPMLSPNWSPDGKKVAYFDDLDQAWVLLTQEKAQFLLDIGLQTPYESQWASDSRTLALRTDDFIFLFDTECRR
ncbi:hypothetical protein [Anaerolinea sp.]|uniref:hypothetical protein n=1 Tax=Anaerolinea sp. TaxID=1872519 RepID=UPI002ACEA7D8|nr:hypothetical protein [Anaerolinea sp.]